MNCTKILLIAIDNNSEYQDKKNEIQFNHLLYIFYAFIYYNKYDGGCLKRAPLANTHINVYNVLIGGEAVTTPTFQLGNAGLDFRWGHIYEKFIKTPENVCQQDELSIGTLLRIYMK